LRGYSAAYAAPGNNPAIDIYDTATDLITTTINVLSDGTLDLASVATFIGLHGAVAVSKLYDQTGNGLHLVAGGVAARVPLTLTAIGTRPAMTFDGSNNFLAGSGFTQLQPFTISVVQNQNGASTGGLFVHTGDTGLYGGGTNLLQLYAGAAADVTATNNSWISVHAKFNGSSSLCLINGTSSTSLVCGSGAPSSAAVTLGSYLGGSFLWPGMLAECGEAGDISLSYAALESNIRAWYGF
jgi:hypothetical protein